MGKRIAALVLALLLAAAGAGQAEQGGKAPRRESWRTERRDTVYAWLPEELPAGEKAPMVVAMNCTGGNPEAEVKTNGWDKLCAEEGFIVIAPEYRDRENYAEAEYLRTVIEDALGRYPADPERVYVTGFSNGGAAAIALASEYPEMIAGISAAGWLVEARNTGHGMTVPFQLLKGTEEFTVRNSRGDLELSDGEKDAVRSLFEMNGMDPGETDYHTVPCWGYRPDRQTVIRPEYRDYPYYGGNGTPCRDVEWRISEYCREGYAAPFARLVLIEGANHTPHDYHARLAWDFFSGFRKVNGQTVEKDRH